MVLGFAAGYVQRCQTNGTVVWPRIFNEPLIFPMLVVLVVIWLLPHNPYPTQLKSVVMQHYNSLPSVQFDVHPSQTLSSRYPANKTALYIEPREGTAFLVPLLLHMIMVVPPDWRFVFFGSSATVNQVRASYTAAMYEALGKLHVRNLEEDWGTGWARKGWEEKEKLDIEELTSRLLTNKTFYEKELPSTEWLLTYHSDAILCANSNVSLDDWLGWDWVGAPWNNGAKFGGVGGLSLRRVSKVREVLEFQERQDNSGPEDWWMSSRLGLLPDANMCPPEKEKEFAVEDIWHEWPMGYHMNHAGPAAEVWRPIQRRHEIYDYCPELKIILDMNLEREKCPEQQDAEAREGEGYRSQSQAEQEQQAEEARKEEQEKQEAEARQQQEKEKARVEAAKKKEEDDKMIEKARERIAEHQREKELEAAHMDEADFADDAVAALSNFDTDREHSEDLEDFKPSKHEGSGEDGPLDEDDADRFSEDDSEKGNSDVVKEEGDDEVDAYDRDRVDR